MIHLFKQGKHAFVTQSKNGYTIMSVDPPPLNWYGLRLLKKIRKTNFLKANILRAWVEFLYEKEVGDTFGGWLK